MEINLLASCKFYLMKKTLITPIFILFCFIGSIQKASAWGKTGHSLVAEVAFKLLDDSTQKIVKQYLGNLTIEEAANWMDNERSNSYYNFMRPWHYINIDKGAKYTPGPEKNILSVLHSAIVELRNRKATDMSKKEIKNRLLLIFHLVGDIHQPLHNGYSIDKGGNAIEITSPYVSGNLHSVWDTQILEYKRIDLDTCMNLYNSMPSDEIAELSKVNELKWMYQSRSYLDRVYSLENNYMDLKYIDNNISVIKRQLVIGGIRLASVLNELFNPANKG